MRISKKTLLKSFLTTTLLIFGLTGCGKSKDLKLGTGGTGGNYYAYGNVISLVAENEVFEDAIIVKETAGSAANLRLMKENFLDMAIVQSDVLSDAINGEGDFLGMPYNNVRVVAGLYMEACQIIVPADSNIESIRDLKGKRVSVGAEESGVEKVAEEVLTAAGVGINNVEAKNLSFAESAEAMVNGDIDAFFVVAGAPTTAVAGLTKDMDIRVLDLDERTIEYMLSLYPGYVEAIVPAGTYSGQEEEVYTVGVKAVLVADNNVSKEQISFITALLFEHASDIKYSLAIAETPNLEFATSDLPGTFHDGAADYYESHSVSVETNEETGQKTFIFGGQD